MGCELAFLSKIIIDEDLWLDVDLGGGEVSASIAAGEYETIFDFVLAVSTAFKTLSGTAVCAMSDLTRGHVQFGDFGAFDILWNSGTHAANNVGEILGFDISADDINLNIYTSDNRHQFGWYDPVGPDSDSYDRKQSMGPRSFVAMSSSVSRTTYARHHIREIAFQWIPAEYFFESDAATNEAYELWWIEVAEGLPFHIFSSLDLSPGNWVDEGKYALEVDENDDLLDGVPRLAPGSPFYSFRLRMRKQE